MKKIAINTCYGGFGLSPDAVEEYYRLKGKSTFFFKAGKNIGDPHVPVSKEEVSKESHWYASDVENPASEEFFGLWSIKRDDPFLISAIENIGLEKSNIRYSKINIIEIPDDVDWDISDYDGVEAIYDKNRYWS